MSARLQAALAAGATLTTVAIHPMPRDASPFDRAACALDMLSDGPWVHIEDGLWTQLSVPEQAELQRRAAARGVELRNERVTL